jgi:hypothetical protein
MIETLTADQISAMRHALGLNYKKKPSRNYYYTSRKNPVWCDLESKGLAITSAGWEADRAYFFLTFEGAKTIFTKPMSRKYFEAL